MKTVLKKTYPIDKFPNHAVPYFSLRIPCTVFPVTDNGQFVFDPYMFGYFIG